MGISIYLPQTMVSRVKAAAAKDNRSISQFIRLALLEKMKGEKK